MSDTTECYRCGLVDPGPEHRANVPALCNENMVREQGDKRRAERGAVRFIDADPDDRRGEHRWVRAVSAGSDGGDR